MLVILVQIKGLIFLFTQQVKMLQNKGGWVQGCVCGDSAKRATVTCNINRVCYTSLTHKDHIQQHVHLSRVMIKSKSRASLQLWLQLKIIIKCFPLHKTWTCVLFLRYSAFSINSSKHSSSSSFQLFSNGFYSSRYDDSNIKSVFNQGCKPDNFAYL